MEERKKSQKTFQGFMMPAFDTRKCSEARKKSSDSQETDN